MKVKKLVALKNNYFKVEFDNEQSLKVHEEDLIKHTLYSGKELTEEEFNHIEKTLDYTRAYIKAIQYISFKIRSKHEIEAYLSEDYSNEIIEATIERLIEENYINDELYAEALKNTMINTTDKGPILFRQELIKKRIDESIIESKVDAYYQMIDRERIEKIRDKELKRYKGSKKLFKQKFMQRLMTKGYTSDFVDFISLDISFDDEEYFEKDFEKYYNKYARKHSGFELKNRLIQSLLGRGYEYSRIDEKLGSMEDEFI